MLRYVVEEVPSVSVFHNDIGGLVKLVLECIDDTYWHERAPLVRRTLYSQERNASSCHVHPLTLTCWKLDLNEANTCKSDIRISLALWLDLNPGQPFSRVQTLIEMQDWFRTKSLLLLLMGGMISYSGSQPPKHLHFQQGRPKQQHVTNWMTTRVTTQISPNSEFPWHYDLKIICPHDSTSYYAIWRCSRFEPSVSGEPQYDDTQVHSTNQPASFDANSNGDWKHPKPHR